jgi:hypothetical protein
MFAGAEKASTLPARVGRTTLMPLGKRGIYFDKTRQKALIFQRIHRERNARIAAFSGVLVEEAKVTQSEITLQLSLCAGLKVSVMVM